jgi:hypothetical protein
MPFRVAADVLRRRPPADVRGGPETLRVRTLKIGEQLCDIRTARPQAAAMSNIVSTDSTFIGRCEGGGRRLKVPAGNVEASDGKPWLFGVVGRFGEASRQSAEPPAQR